MIYDKIENIGRYDLLNQVKEFDFSNYEKGKFGISGDEFFGIGLEYDTRNEADCLWEAHRSYLDVHCILEGEELVNITDIANTTVTKEYDAAGDYGLFNGTKEHTIHLKKGMFLVLYPNEVHQTAVVAESVSSVKKIVFKIKVI